MAGDADLVTVFRSADLNAEEQAIEVRDLLREAGFRAELFSDEAEGVVENTYEVRVPPSEAQGAEQLIASHQELIEEPVDISHELDMATVFSSDAHNAEMLATGIRAILDANGIPSVLVSGSPFPNLPYEVRVPKTRLDEARRAIAAAEEAGPTAAEEAERESEGGL